MARCEVCGNDYDKAMEITVGAATLGFDPLEGAGAVCVAARGARVLAGTRERGALLSDDAGDTWEPLELPEPGVSAVAIGAEDGALYAGTEPSRVFVARDGGPFLELEALQD